MGQPKDPAFSSLLNGRLASTLLAPIQGGSHKLWPDAANAWNALVAAAAGDGVAITITDSYRTFAEQVDCARRKGLTSQGGLCATPGNSNHGWGLAVDVDPNNTERMDWLRANAARFGFARTVNKESWHYEYIPLSGSRAVDGAEISPGTSSVGALGFTQQSLPIDIVNGAVDAVLGAVTGGPAAALSGVAGAVLDRLNPLDGLPEALWKIALYAIPSAAGLALVVLGAQMAAASTLQSKLTSITRSI